jgi:hypothetical protein
MLDLCYWYLFTYTSTIQHVIFMPFNNNTIVPPVEQELLTLPLHPRSAAVVSGVIITEYLSLLFLVGFL